MRRLSHSLPRCCSPKGKSGSNPTPIPLNSLTGEFKIGSWSCRVLFVDDSCKRALSLNVLRKLAGKVHVLCLQETHGLPFEVSAELRSLLPGWQVLHSSCHDRGSLNITAAGWASVVISPRTIGIADFEHKM